MSDASVNLGVANDGVDTKTQIGFPIFLLFYCCCCVLQGGTMSQFGG